MVEFFTSIQPAVSTALSAIIGAIVIYLGKVIADFIISLSKKHDIEISEAEIKKFTNDLATIVADAIVATNQTYVNELKAKGEFTKEAQKEANERALKYCLNLMSVEMVEYINAVYGDAEALLLTKIEAMIGSSKKQIVVDSTNGRDITTSDSVLQTLFSSVDNFTPVVNTDNPFYLTLDHGVDTTITPI